MITTFVLVFFALAFFALTGPVGTALFMGFCGTMVLLAFLAGDEK